MCRQPRSPNGCRCVDARSLLLLLFSCHTLCRWQQHGMLGVVVAGRDGFPAYCIHVEHCSNLNAGLGSVWLMFLRQSGRVYARTQGCKHEVSAVVINSVILLELQSATDVGFVQPDTLHSTSDFWFELNATHTTTKIRGVSLELLINSKAKRRVVSSNHWPFAVSHCHLVDTSSDASSTSAHHPVFTPNSFR